MTSTGIGPAFLPAANFSIAAFWNLTCGPSKMQSTSSNTPVSYTHLAVRTIFALEGEDDRHARICSVGGLFRFMKITCLAHSIAQFDGKDVYKRPDTVHPLPVY